MTPPLHALAMPPAVPPELAGESGDGPRPGGGGSGRFGGSGALPEGCVSVPADDCTSVT